MNDKYNLTTSIDYNNNLFNATVVATGTTEYSTLEVDIFSPKGYAINRLDLIKIQDRKNGSVFFGSSALGLRLASQGKDTSIGTEDLSGVYYSELYTNWPFSNSVDVGVPYKADYITNFEVPYALDTILVSSLENTYINTPLLITRGDAVLFGTVSTVIDENKITLTQFYTGNTYSSYNLSNSLIEVVSGADLGKQYYTTSQVGSTLTLTNSAYNLSGQVVKIQPIRKVTSYTPWEIPLTYRSSIFGAFGSNGASSRFSLDQNIPIKVGSVFELSGIDITSIYSGDLSPTTTHPLDTTESFPINTSFIGMHTSYLESNYFDVVPGDLIIYTPTTAPSETRTGVVSSVFTFEAGSTGYTVANLFNPEGDIDLTYPITIHRHNQFTLMEYPEFGSEFMCVLNSDSEVLATATLETPEAVLETSANEYESTYSIIPETSHFHVGPVTLTNGQTLSGFPVSVSFSVENGDVVSPTTVLSSEGNSLQHVSVGHLFDGKYYKDGVFTAPASTVFNASETLFLKAEVSYGSAKITKTVTIPVQPAI